MGWDERLAGLFEDLEQQAAALALEARDAEVAALRVGEYAQVDLAARWHGSVGAWLVLRVEGVGVLEGRLRRVGAGWLLLAGAAEWLVTQAAVVGVRGLGERAVPTEQLRVGHRLGLGSALRHLGDRQAGGGSVALVHRRDGAVLRGLLARVGADFVEVHLDEEPAALEVVPFTALAAVRSA